ncbi:MAG: leucyl aminopeptidase [Chloroflexi bacterium]|nr:leucyl aminopeptidase [Chloroflexota bacterium]
MDVIVQAARLADAAADAVVLNLFEGVKQPGGATGAVDAALGGAISRLIDTGDFTGKLNQTAVLYPAAPATPAAPVGRSAEGGVAAQRVVLVGLGTHEEFTTDRVRQVAATAARKARDLGARSLATIVHGAGIGGLAPREAAQALVEGSLLGLYRFDRLRSSPDDDDAAKRLERLTIVELDTQKVPEIEAGVTRGRILAESTTFARDLSTEPANRLTPRALAEAARTVASEVGLRCEVLEPPQIAALEMGAFMGVAQGSDEPAQFIILEHAPEGTDDQPPVVLCGKAVTFDTGGISIKPHEGMWQMKDDMAGGAAVLGAMRALALLHVPRRTIGLIPATENMPSGHAIRPGDVLRAMDGQTIEIISTDAEGRLILADALAFAHRYRPAALVDVATLTGAVVTALGHGVAGVMGNDEDVVDRLRTAARQTGEKVWELPLWDDAYKRIIKSDIADMKNSGGRPAGAIAGGMLLKRFAKDVPWAHVDIAGVSWADHDSPYTPKGATGFGVRLLAAFVASYTGQP